MKDKKTATGYSIALAKTTTILVFLALFLISLFPIGAIPASAAAEPSARAAIPLAIGINASKGKANQLVNNTDAISDSSLNLHIGINISDTYPSIAAKRLGQVENPGKWTLQSLPPNYSEILLHLPLAEQNEIMQLSLDDAVSRLSKYRLVSLNKTQLYTERVIPEEIAAAAAAKAAESKTAHLSIMAQIQQIITRFLAAKQDQKPDQATELAKQYLLSTIDLYTQAINRIKYNAELSDDLTVAQAAAIAEKADAEIAKLEQIRTVVTAAKTKDEVEAARKDVLEIMQQIGPKIKSDSVMLMQTRLSEVVKRDEQMERKIECSLDSMKKNSTNTTLSEEMLGELSAKIAFAKEDLKNAKGYNLLGNYTQAELKTTSAQAKLNEAYLTLKDLVKEIKAEKGQIIDCQSDTPGTVVVVEEN